jgi:hypothetical protein
MSTAKTSVGCLAEDYSKELRDICQDYLDQLLVGEILPEYAQRVADVAASFVIAADSELHQEQ